MRNHVVVAVSGALLLLTSACGGPGLDPLDPLDPLDTTTGDAGGHDSATSSDGDASDGGGATGGNVTTDAGADTARGDPCAPDPCNGHGECSNVAGAAVCTCTGNFAGATCVSCKAGYTGADCLTEIDECSPNPCKNAGVCTDGLASFTCACKAVWTGTTCATVPGLLANSNATCKEENFLDLSLWLPDPNPSYADPQMSVSCTATTMSITSNGMPPYDVEPDPWSQNLVVSNTTYTVKLSPAYTTTITYASVVGGVGIAINGIRISTPSASGGPLKFGDPEAIEADGDQCDGHPNPSGSYHYHSLKPSCFFANAENGDLKGQACTAPSPILGYLYDGFPILGPCECLDAACTQVVEMRSSYKLQGGDDDPEQCAYQDYQYVGDPNEHTDGDKFLDECNGHVGPNGDYHYHMTNEYPWTTRCWHGTPVLGMNGGSRYDATDPPPKPDAEFECRCKNGVFDANATCQ